MFTRLAALTPNVQFVRSNLLIAAAAIVSVVTMACGDQRSAVTAPSISREAGSRSESAPRRGALHVTKDCSRYTGHAGDFCTITTSNLAQIAIGSKVVYAKDAVGTALDTDVALYAPGGGRDVALGHCALSLATGIGECRFSGGTGAFAGFHAKVAVSYLGGPDFAWDGTYHFDRSGQESDED